MAAPVASLSSMKLQPQPRATGRVPATRPGVGTSSSPAKTMSSLAKTPAGVPSTPAKSLAPTLPVTSKPAPKPTLATGPSRPSPSKGLQSVAASPKEPSAPSKSAVTASKSVAKKPAGKDGKPAETSPAMLETPVCLPPPPPADVLSSNTITYSHYNSAFPTKNGVMLFSDIDDQYCLTFVFKGDFKATLLSPDGSQKIARNANGEFVGLTPDTVYQIEIEEDPAIVREARKPAPLLSQRAQVGDALRGARAEGCSCLYGNPCADQYVCQNWKDRFEIATKNGWKGF